MERSTGDTDRAFHLTEAAKELQQSGISEDRLTSVRIGAQTLGDYMAQVTDLSYYGSVWRSLGDRLQSVRGMVRFYLRSASPLQLYVSPINIDPSAPALPISTPADYASALAARVGRFYTQGIAEDTKALEAGAFGDAEFVEQSDTLLAERGRMLDAVLDDYDGGFLFFYVSTIDQSCHALWRNTDAHHPAHPASGARRPESPVSTARRRAPAVTA